MTLSGSSNQLSPGPTVEMGKLTEKSVETGSSSSSDNGKTIARFCVLPGEGRCDEQRAGKNLRTTSPKHKRRRKDGV
ncbi:hypothetical protein Trydic_g15654 [Trypoxylus dichotomus]